MNAAPGNAPPGNAELVNAQPANAQPMNAQPPPRADPAEADLPVPLPEPLRRGTAALVLRVLPGSRAVGGCVRDALAGRPIADVDVGVPLPPEAVSARLRAAGLRVFDTGLAHGTVTAVRDGEAVEVTSLRRDLETDGRHATVAWTTDWREDAARRDFTINAMSLDLEGRLWDWFGGRDDLRAGLVRFVGDPATRLREDALRALRFFRFQARYGRGAPDPAAVAAIAAAVPALARLSVERVWSELKRLLGAPDPAAALALMAATGVLGAVLPEAVAAPGLPPEVVVQPEAGVSPGLQPDAVPGSGALAGAVVIPGTLPHAVAALRHGGRLRRLLVLGAPPEPLLRLAALLGPADPPGLVARLKLSREEAARLSALAGAAGVPGPGAEAGAVAAWRARAGFTPPSDAGLALFLAEATDGQPREAARWHAAAPPPAFPLHGRDALALGLPPGPGMGAVLRQVEAWWIDTGCTADTAACRDRLRALIGVIAAPPVPPGAGSG